MSMSVSFNDVVSVEIEPTHVTSGLMPGAYRSIILTFRDGKQQTIDLFAESEEALTIQA